MRERLEALLLAERDRTASDLHQVEEDEAEAPMVSGGGLVRTEWAQAEVASDVQEEEGDFIIATRASAHLAEIDEALRLLAADPQSFGRCSRCDVAIEWARLELVPWSRLCAACARADGRLR
jgi:RNA polymerase-binding transcription factor DksA